VNAKPSLIPSDGDGGTLVLDGHRVALTNLGKVYFPELGVTKGDLLAYYLAIAGTILPHVSGRAIVMKRYPNGVDGAFFYMKRAPAARPAWIRTCSIEHGSGSTIAFPVIDDRASLLWVINLGCIDLDPWYSFCDDPDRPLYLHFDLDPTEGASTTIRMHSERRWHRPTRYVPTLRRSCRRRSRGRRSRTVASLRTSLCATSPRALRVWATFGSRC
jgi:hypothetical protein